MSGPPSAALSDVLGAILRSRGADILVNRRRLFGLLRDKAPNDLRAVRLLMLAFDEGVPSRFQDATLSEADVQRETARMINDTGMAPDFARVAVLAWAQAMTGYVPPAAPATAPPPRPVQPIPAQPLSVQPLPVQPLPVQPLPVSPAASPQPVQPAAGANPWIKLAKIMLGLVVAGFGVAKLISVLDRPSQDTPQAPTEAPTQAPAPTPRQAPVQTPTQAPTATPAPGPATGGTTPDGYAIITTAPPYPRFTAYRIGKDTNTLQFSFGLQSGSRAFTFLVAFRFNGTQERGQAFINAAFNGQEVTTGQQAGVRPAVKNERQLETEGEFQNNAIAAPRVYVIVGHISPRLDQVELQSTSDFCVYNSVNGKQGSVLFGCADLE